VQHGIMTGIQKNLATSVRKTAGRRRPGCLLRRMSRGMATGFLAVMLLIGLGVERAAAQETADLQITKVASSKTVRVGETVTYTVTLTNLGPGVATGVVFGDSMPDQLNLVESTCGSVSAFCSIAALPPGPALRSRSWQHRSPTSHATSGASATPLSSRSPQRRIPT
jgi:uncharacterized repeat protein (TIGR01451 family)